MELCEKFTKIPFKRPLLVLLTICGRKPPAEEPCNPVIQSGRPIRSSNLYRIHVNLGSDLWVRMPVSPSVQHLCVDLTDVSLAEEDTNSILTDNVNGANEGNVAMQVLQGAYFGSNASGVSRWPNFEPMQVARYQVAKFATSVSGPKSDWLLMQVAPSAFAINAILLPYLIPVYGVNFWVRYASGNV